MEEIYMNQKHICLAPFPFSDLSFEKIRPVLILSNNEYNKNSSELIVCAITSKLGKDYSINISSKDLQKGKLFKESSIKFDTLFKIEKSLLIKTIGKLKNKKFEKIKEKVLSLF
jgi:mRNA interferase MazF